MAIEPKKHEMPTQAPEVRAHNFQEVALGYTEEIAIAEAQRCLNCKNKPCISGCPVNINIPSFIEQMKKAGVHTELIEHLDGQTGHAIIQKDPAGQNCILLYGGANQRITKEMVDRVLTQFEADDFLILQNEISEIGYIMEKAHEKGMKIVLNPSPMNAKILSYPLEYVDYFLLNEVEASDICGIEATKDPQALMNGLVKRFPEAKIVLTLGGDGSVYRDGDTVLRQGIYKVPVVDTTAAGDTFTGYFIGGLQLGEDPKTALEHAAKAAAIAVSRPGAAPSVPNREEVETFEG